MLWNDSGGFEFKCMILGNVIVMIFGNVIVDDVMVWFLFWCYEYIIDIEKLFGNIQWI